MKKSLNKKARKKKKVSIVIPAYNEEECVDELSIRLKKVFAVENQYTFEVVVVENGSTDNTWEKLEKINKDDDRFKILRLSRNFRMDGGITAGLEFIDGDCCVIMTADLQDPPEAIHKFLREWENGIENVYAVIRKRHGTSPIRRVNSLVFYRLASFLSDGRITKNASDFRLVDRKVYETIRNMNERNRFVRGLFSWAGFRSIGIEIERPPRFGGKSNAHTFEVIDLAIKGIFAHTYKPLKLITLIGIFLSLIAIGILFSLVALWIIKGVPFPGYGSIMAVLLLLLSFSFLLMGVIGEYVGLIYEEVKARPNYIVTEKIGFKNY